jgi:hypothetical protein
MIDRFDLIHAIAAAIVCNSIALATVAIWWALL